MWEVSQEVVVAVAHRVPAPKGPDGRPGVEKLHGHNWRVVAVAEAAELDEHGLVIDVDVLGALLRELVGPYDHAFLNDIPPFDRLISTAERFAWVVAEKLAPRLDDGRVRLVRIEIWETYIRKATYIRRAP